MLLYYLTNTGRLLSYAKIEKGLQEAAVDHLLFADNINKNHLLFYDVPTHSRPLPTVMLV